MLETVQRLGLLQLDPIATVAPPQHLVLWSRLGSVDTAELDRLLWEERRLVEYNAFVYPIETLPLLRARMRHNRRSTRYDRDRWRREFLRRNAAFRRYVLRELEQRGPLLSRELEDRSSTRACSTAGTATGTSGSCWKTLHVYGEIAVVGRRGRQRLWDLAERWYPETETVPWREAERRLDEQRFRAVGVRLEKGRVRRASRRSRRASAGPRDVPLPLRPARVRPRPRRGPVRLLLPARDVRAGREARVRLLRASDPQRRPARRPHRACLRPQGERVCA